MLSEWLMPGVALVKDLTLAYYVQSMPTRLVPVKGVGGTPDDSRRLTLSIGTEQVISQAGLRRHDGHNRT